MQLYAAENKLAFIVKYWLPSLGWALVIFCLSSRPFGNFALPFTHFDKLVHMGEYGILCLLLYRALIHTSESWWKKRAVMFSILLCILYGISDEIHQMFVPMRKLDALDLLADGLGAGLFHIGLWSVRSFRFRRETRI
jgi:VanZ family protein